MSEESKMIMQQELQEEEDIISTYLNIPYFILDDEVSSSVRSRYEREFNQINRYYDVYKRGSFFLSEGSNADYIPSRLRYKKATMIVNKEARFLFSNTPTFNVNPDDVDGANKEENSILQNYLDKVLEMNNFSGDLLKGLKDCFIGKRIAIVVNFNDDGITITFLKPTEFIYETDGTRNDNITKFVTFFQINDCESLKEQRWYKKRYTKENGIVYLEEIIYDGTGEVIEIPFSKSEIRLPYIPVAVVLNDALTGDYSGTSELGDLIEYEKYYSKLANADMDAERKSMNPIKYTVDASEGSTKKLSTSPGSFWDLQSDEEKAETRNAKVGTLEAQMNYSVPLKTTLDRIENEMYAELDVPNITSEQLAGVITSGKTIQALYWGLTVRCDEKMLAWGYALQFIARTIIEGGILYPEYIGRYTTEKRLPEIEFEILVENNYPIPEDVKEEKELDISEVESNIMSRKAYLKKWRKLSDIEAMKEIEQIQLEKQMLEDSMVDLSNSDNQDGVEEEDVDDTEIDPNSEIDDEDNQIDDENK